MADEELLAALANSRHAGADLLTDRDAVADWWTAVEPAVGRALASAPADPGVASLRALREAVRRLAWGNNAVDVPEDSGLDEKLGELALRASLRGGRPEVWATHGAEASAVVTAAVLSSLMRASARSSWPRLKACQSLECGWVFLDASRNTSRRWCDMAGCGNRAKSRAFRARSRGGAPSD